MRKLKVTKTALAAWHDAIVEAQDACHILLPEDSEYYLVTLLLRYTNQPQFVNNVLGAVYLESLQEPPKEQQASLRLVGDQCLLFAGLFPEIAKKRRVSLDYYLDIGKSAYHQLSNLEKVIARDLYHELAQQFLYMASILQSLRSLSANVTSERKDLEAIWQNVDNISKYH